MKKYKVTLGTVRCGGGGNSFEPGPETRTVFAKTRVRAAQSVLGTRSKLTLDHDIPEVLAIDSEFQAHGSCGYKVQAAMVIETTQEWDT